MPDAFLATPIFMAAAHVRVWLHHCPSPLKNRLFISVVHPQSYVNCTFIRVPRLLRRLFTLPRVWLKQVLDRFQSQCKLFLSLMMIIFCLSGGNEHETSLNSNDDIFRGLYNDDLIDVVPGQSTDVFSTSLMSTKSGQIQFSKLYVAVKLSVRHGFFVCDALQIVGPQ